MGRLEFWCLETGGDYQGIIWVRSPENSCTTDGAAGGGWVGEGEKQGHRIIVRSQGIRRKGKFGDSTGN